MKDKMKALLQRTPVVPVITLNRTDQAVPLARALIAGGITVLEITLRTAEGLPAIERIKREVPEAIVGAGTVTCEHDLQCALAAGSDFIITPGCTDRLLKAGIDSGVPFMPGIATVSELMTCLESGLEILKFFPAESIGGVKALKAIGGPFPNISFCPTGGIGPKNLTDYLAIPSVVSVGGSWVAPTALIDAGEWELITERAREVRALTSGVRKTS